AFIIGYGSSPSRCGPEQRTAAGQTWDLPVPVQGASAHARFFDHAGPFGPCDGASETCCLPRSKQRRRPRIGFRGSMAGLCPPLPTLRRRPYGRQRTARGRCGSLLLHRSGLAPPHPCRSPGALRVLHAQPRSPLSVAHIRHLKKFTTFYTVSATKARAAASGRGARPNDQLRSETRPSPKSGSSITSSATRQLGDRLPMWAEQGTTSVLRAVFASRDEPMASAPALPEATVSGQFVQIFGRKENPRGGDVLVKVRHR